MQPDENKARTRTTQRVAEMVPGEMASVRETGGGPRKATTNVMQGREWMMFASKSRRKVHVQIRRWVIEWAMVSEEVCLIGRASEMR
jgi:hypothetical protein